MERETIYATPESDHETIRDYTRTHGGAIVLRVHGRLGSAAKSEMLRYRKEHGELPPYDFVWIEDPEWESSAADVDGAAGSESGLHESVGERQGRQPTPGFWGRLWRRLTGPTVAELSQPIPPERDWLDDDDPLARVINAAWETGKSAHWTEGDPLPEKVENPKKIERGADGG